jgi:hypothetical protein
MYLFSRRTRLGGGNGTAGLEWAVSMVAKVNEITGHEIQLWGNVYSPGYGTVSWTGWFEDLSSLEALGDKLEADPGYLEAANKGAQFTEGGLDDMIFTPIYGEPDPGQAIQYVSGVTGVIAAGNYERAMSAGVAIAQKAEKLTGLTTMFGSSLTGPYGSVGFLTGYENIAALEAAQNRIASDASWLKLIDSTKGCFVEDAAITQSTIYRRLA